MDKPTDIKAFKKWLKTELNHEIDSSYEYYYTTITDQLKTQFENTTFWRKLINERKEVNDKYLLRKGVNLLILEEQPLILIKSLDSVINKVFRKNILQNNNFPDPPQGGWITPENWFEKLNDIIRTTIIVKYLDGVQFLIDEMEAICRLFNLKYAFELEAREEGYYAAHYGVTIPLSFPDKNFQPIEKNFNIEIQVTTQLQEIIKTLLHKHYEQKRISIPTSNNYKWQWDHKSDEFAPNYLGHIVHYVEGMIIEIRDKENN
ncbi:MAG: hypothetical protein JXR34_12620 [Bacteroidales bacterium]|nr:hypothetical protein [Bacteroidales bacterium]